MTSVSGPSLRNPLLPRPPATTEVGAALEQSRPERWGHRMLGRRSRRAEEQALRGVVEQREREIGMNGEWGCFTNTGGTLW
jgi:hypothetical protein